MAKSIDVLMVSDDQVWADEAASLLADKSGSKVDVALSYDDAKALVQANNYCLVVIHENAGSALKPKGLTVKGGITYLNSTVRELPGIDFINGIEQRVPIVYISTLLTEDGEFQLRSRVKR